MAGKAKSSKRRAPPRRRPSATQPASAQVTTALFRLPAVCTLRDAEEIKQALCALTQDARCVQIDAAAVKRIDTAILQMLVVFHHERRGRGLTTGWSGRAPAFDAAAEQLGLISLLGL
jgi:anti-anti-sigma regulatory factor